MPISVPKSMSKYLDDAIEVAEEAATAIGKYNMIKNFLKQCGVDFQEHNHEDDVPGHHYYWKPK
jgi:hypothetical protein